MFGRLLDLSSTAAFVRSAIVRLAALMLAPALLITLSLLAFVLLPAACAGIPFLVPAFFGGAHAEHEAAVRRSHHPWAHHAPAPVA